MSYNYLGDNMNKRVIDLSDIKDNDLDETSSFTDLMTRKEKRNRDKVNVDSSDIDEMITERRKNTADLTKELQKAKEDYNKNIKEDVKLKNKKENVESEEKEESLAKTQILELTRQMKFNFEENKKENVSKSKGVTFLNIIGIFNLICIGFYLYLLVFTNYQKDEVTYMITGGLIILLVFLFGLSTVTGRKASKFFKVLNVLTIIAFVLFNIYVLMN